MQALIGEHVMKARIVWLWWLVLGFFWNPNTWATRVAEDGFETTPVSSVTSLTVVTNSPLSQTTQQSIDFGIWMVRIPAGSFLMGSNDDDGGKLPHWVSVGAFELGETEVTQRQWKAVMGWLISGNNPSAFTNCDDCPVERVNWNDVQKFIQKLNQKTGKRYRLPSEAEWEYACRAGGQHEYCGSDGVESVAWYIENKELKTHPVGQKQANAWGLYDMSGNVAEWVQDCWNESYNGAPSDGSAWESGYCGRRVLRGGSWFSNPGDVRATNRYREDETDRDAANGFRLARMLP